MIRFIEGERPAWVLDTDNTTYAFRVLPTGQLEQLYYGKRLLLETAEDLSPLTERHAYPPSCAVVYDNAHPEFSLENACLEYSSPGKGDLREPMLELVHADGGRTSDFVYRVWERTDKRPSDSPLPFSVGPEGRTETLCVTLTDTHYRLRLELRYTVWPECDVLCRSARLVNDSSAPVEIDRLMSMQLDLPDTGWVVSSFHGAHCREMERFAVPLPAGKFVNEARGGCSSNHSNPFFMLHRPDTSEDGGDCFGFNLIYSGAHYAAAEVGAFGRTRVVSGINPHGFRWLLGPGESFEAPEAVLSYSAQGFGTLSRNMHRFVRDHIVRGVWQYKPRPVLLNSWEASYFNFTESSLVSLARSGKDLGIELFVMDDGWFGERDDDTRGLGDWDVNLKKLPGGLSGLADKVRALGMDFGLWVEPEMVNVNSALYRTHPDWAMAIPGKPHSEGRTQRLLDLGNPAVQDFLIEKMTEVFSSAAISYVKWDFNRFFSDIYSPALPPERQGEAGHRYVLGLYRVMRTLTERFPGILFEGCASGGNRFDLGILSYFPQIWASDNTDAVSRARIQEGYSYGYPTSVMGAHVSACPNHQTLRMTPMDTRFNVAACGLLGYELNLRDLGAEDRREIRGQISRYKRWREVFQFGEFYRSSTPDRTMWTLVSPDKKRAVGLMMQELTRPNSPFDRFLPRGLDAGKRYHFHNIPRRLNIKRFGSLVNTVAPFHVKQDSLLHNVIAKAVTMPGEREDMTASGGTLMGGVKLSPAYCGTGYNGDVRYFQDFSSRLYFMEEAKAGRNKDRNARKQRVEK
ncbi:MAG: alpha-galactosidase [Oscillospiraceae bacterium]|nr:alpha-galactosidase [Oscillospiraceae bacterium]